jgi:hypothetical protein
VSVQVFATSGGAALDTTTSAADGTYALSMATGGSPTSVYFLTSKTGYWDSYVYPPYPLFAQLVGIPLVSYQSTLLSTVATAFGVPQTAGNGVMFVAVWDCASTPIAGATVSTTPSLTPHYTANNLPSPTSTQTTADGNAVFLDVPPGSIVIGATVGGKTLRGHTVVVHADAATLTVVMP